MPFKFALSAGVGLFLTLSGLINAGLITADETWWIWARWPRRSRFWRCWGFS